jgi:hypothetical protein
MIALDTNIFIYACDRSEAARQQVALDLIAGAADGVLLWQVAFGRHDAFGGAFAHPRKRLRLPGRKTTYPSRPTP